MKLNGFASKSKQVKEEVDCFHLALDVDQARVLPKCTSNSKNAKAADRTNSFLLIQKVRLFFSFFSLFFSLYFFVLFGNPSREDERKRTKYRGAAGADKIVQ